MNELLQVVTEPKSTECPTAITTAATTAMANAGSVETGEAAAADGEIAEHRRRSACQLRDAAVALLQARGQSAEEGTQGGAMAITAAAFEVSLPVRHKSSSRPAAFHPSPVPAVLRSIPNPPHLAPSPHHRFSQWKSWEAQRLPTYQQTGESSSTAAATLKRPSA